MDTPTGFDGSGVEGRRVARALLMIGLLLAALTSFLSFAAAGPWVEAWLVALSLLMPIVGLAWMVVIYRRAFDPEPEQDAWRYRAD